MSDSRQPQDVMMVVTEALKAPEPRLTRLGDINLGFAFRLRVIGWGVPPMLVLLVLFNIFMPFGRAFMAASVIGWGGAWVMLYYTPRPGENAWTFLGVRLKSRKGSVRMRRKNVQVYVGSWPVPPWLVEEANSRMRIVPSTVRVPAGSVDWDGRLIPNVSAASPPPKRPDSFLDLRSPRRLASGLPRRHPLDTRRQQPSARPAGFVSQRPDRPPRASSPAAPAGPLGPGQLGGFPPAAQGRPLTTQNPQQNPWAVPAPPGPGSVWAVPAAAGSVPPGPHQFGPRAPEDLRGDRRPPTPSPSPSPFWGAPARPSDSEPPGSSRG